MGFVTAIGGFTQTAYVDASKTTSAWLVFDAIAACVIGGINFKGELGSIVGVLFGSLTMATLLDGMRLLSIAPEEK